MKELLTRIVVQAQVALPNDIRPDTLPTIKGGSVEGQVTTLVGDFVLTAIQFGGAIAIIFIVISGFRYAVSQGEDEQMGKAKAGLIWSSVALVILILAYSIVYTVFNIAVSLGGN